MTLRNVLLLGRIRRLPRLPRSEIRSQIRDTKNAKIKSKKVISPPKVVVI